MEYEIADDPQGLPEDGGWMSEPDFVPGNRPGPDTQRPGHQRAIDFPEQMPQPS